MSSWKRLSTAKDTKNLSSTQSKGQNSEGFCRFVKAAVTVARTRRCARKEMDLSDFQFFNDPPK